MAKRSSRRLDFTYREQTQSTDLNRAQAFADATLMEILRHLLFTESSVSPSGDLGPVLAYRSYTTKLAPMLGEVLGGLVLSPTANSLGCVISDGAVLAVDPDPLDTGDDSPFRFGTGGATAFGVAPNSSGSTRIDVVEVAVVEDVTEVTSVSVYDEDTGLFTPELADKVAKGSLSVRIREGIPGSGIPAGVEGYLPLYLITVPDGTLTQFEDTTVVFWDVRPLAQQRIGYGIQNSRWTADSSTYLETANLYTSGAGPIMSGTARVVLNGRHIGGTVINPRTATSPDASGTDNNAGGYTPGANQLHYTYVGVPIMPGSSGHPAYDQSGVVLPQCGGFLVGSSGLAPLMRSLPIFAGTLPFVDGTAYLNAPTWTGFSAVMKSVIVGWTATDVGSNVYPFSTAGKTSEHPAPAITGTHSGGECTWTLSSTTHFPNNATELTLQVAFNFKTTVASPGDVGYVRFLVEYDGSGEPTNLPDVTAIPQPTTTGAASFTYYTTVRVSRPRGTATMTLTTAFTFNAGGEGSHVIDTGIVPTVAVAAATL